MNWGRLKRLALLFIAAQVCFLVGSATIAVEPVVGIGIVLVGVVFGTKWLIAIVVGADNDKNEGRPA